MRNAECDGIQKAEDDILGFFAEKLECYDEEYVCETQSVLLAIDEWYFVPRTRPYVFKQLARVRAAIRMYKAFGTLPKHYRKAFAYARGVRYQRIEAQYRAHELGGHALQFKINIFLKTEDLIPSKD